MRHGSVILKSIHSVVYRTLNNDEDDDDDNHNEDGNDDNDGRRY